MESTIYIYGLLDPNDPCQQIRYVGRTVDPKARLDGHIHESKITNSKKSIWINEVLSGGELPEMKILEETDEKNCNKAEQKWIDKYGNQLVNGCPGGGGAMPKDDKLNVMSVRIDENDVFRLKTMADRDGRSASNYLRKIIHAHFRAYDEGKTNGKTN